MAPEPDELEPELGDLVGDAGPAFEPAVDVAGAPPVDVAGALEGGSKWHATRVASILQAQGAVVHSVLAVDKGRSQEWLYTKADLDAIAPAMTRILNRYPATRIAAEGGDELAVALGFGGYFMRSYSERRAALQAGRVETAAAATDAYETPPAPATAPTVDVQTADDVEWPEVSDTPPIRPRP